MSAAKDYQFLKLKRADVDNLVLAYAVPEFCWPVNDFFTLQMKSLGLLYCSECYEQELREFACPIQRKRFIDHTIIDEDYIEGICGDEVIELIYAIGNYCCKCEKWSVVFCIDSEAMTNEIPNAMDCKIYQPFHKNISLRFNHGFTYTPCTVHSPFFR
jgi:hypothetical protein